MSTSGGETERRLEALMRRIEQLEAEMRRLKLREAERARTDAQRNGQRESQQGSQRESQQGRQREGQSERQQERRSDNTNTNYYITIEHLQMERPVLEQLAFQLDSLDIKELSGSLNLGNNFGSGSGEAIRLPVRNSSAPGEGQAGREQRGREEATRENATQEDAKRERSRREDATHEKVTGKEAARYNATRENVTQERSVQNKEARENATVASSRANPSGSTQTKAPAKQTNAENYKPSAPAAATPGAGIAAGFTEPVRAPVWHKSVEEQETKSVMGQKGASGPEVTLPAGFSSMPPRDIPVKDAGAVGNGVRINLNSHRGE